jgi:hypothetical protein
MLVIVLKNAVDSAMTVTDLYDYLTDTRTVEQLDLLGDLDVSEATRHLKAAQSRHGEAKILKLVLALGKLESAYTIFARRADIPWWRSFRASYTRRSAFISAGQVAFTNAVIYQSLGYDGESVRECLTAARSWYLRYNESFKQSIQREIDSGRLNMVGNHPVDGSARIALRRCWLDELDQERQAVNDIVENLPLIPIEPDEALRNRPWFSSVHPPPSFS